MSKKLVVYVVFFTILLGGFLFFTFVGTDNWKVKIPTLGVVQPFNFINQDGKKVTEANLLGKVTVVEYFFTTCKGICPKLNRVCWLGMRTTRTCWTFSGQALTPTLLLVRRCSTSPA